MPLRHVPRSITPELLYNLARMGHGDELVLADAHFPTSSVCRSGATEIRCDSVTDIVDLMEQIMTLMPLDQYVVSPIAMMALEPSDRGKFSGDVSPIFDAVRSKANTIEQRNINIENVERFAFYERAKRAFAVVHTGELRQYANVILKKGVLTSSK